MGWRELLPETARAVVAAPVSIQGFVMFGRKQTMLTLRLDQFDAPAWITRGAGCRVATGQDEHAGQMLISSGGPFEVGTTVGKQINPQVVTLRLPKLPGRVDGVFKREPVRFEVKGTDLIVWLPDWCRGRQPAKAAAP